MIRRYIAGIVAGALLLPEIALGAMLYMEPPLSELRPGASSIIEVRVDVDPEVDECINLVDAVIDFDDAVQVVDTSVGRSILRLWVEEPTVQDDNTVTFAGGIPNGYCGRIQGDPAVTNIVAELVVRAHDQTFTDESATSTARIEFASPTTVYLNDGAGTKASLETYGAELLLIPTPGDDPSDPWLERVRADTTPPEPFTIYLERDDRLFNGRYYIVFNTTDKQTGIAGYEVMEEPLAEQGLFNFGAVGAPWRPARSPYVLQDQTLNSTIRVKAVDKAGNEYVATLVPDPSLREQQLNWIDWVIVTTGGIFLGLLLVIVVLWWRRRRSAVNGVHTSAHAHATDGLSAEDTRYE